MTDSVLVSKKKAGRPKLDRYDHLYEDADKHFLLHVEDPVLSVIKVPLPKCPEWSKIDGYGKHPRKQMFVHEELPYKLRVLQSMRVSDIRDISAQKDRPLWIKEIWHELATNQLYYKEEIIWIKIQWRRRMYGYWFFNNGKPTYLAGHHYAYLNFWNIKSTRYDNLPEYRYRDMMFYNFLNFCKRDEDSFGAVYPKHRREGATSKVGEDEFMEATEGFYRMCGIQSMDGDHAEEVFLEKVVEPWKTLPFFFKPEYQGSNDPKTKLVFKPSSRHGMGGGSFATTRIGLQGLIDFKAAGHKQYDGKQQWYYYMDELGKDGEGAKIDCYKRWLVVKETMAEGDEIKGFTVGTTTVDEITANAARHFKRLCDASMYNQRDKNNRTRSGLFLFFIPAYVNLKGYSDKYGNPIIDDPKTPVKNSDGKYVKIGAKTYLQNMFDGFKKAKDYDGLNEKKRQYPGEYRDVFRRTSSHSGFNVAVLNDRITELMQLGLDKQVRVGNFYWKNGFGSRVLWEDDPAGKFKVSQLLGNDTQGRQKDSLSFWSEDDNSFMPVASGEYFSGSDPFKFVQTEYGKRSRGGFAVFRKYNPRIDPVDKPREEWVTNQFVCTFNNLCDSKEDYAEDCLMATIYYNALHMTENNIDMIEDHWSKWKYSRYLMHVLDSTGTRYKVRPGRSTSSDASKQEMFNEMQQYIKRHGKFEKHLDLLEECADIGGPKDMTNFDLFTAGCEALIGSKSDYQDLVSGQQHDVDAGDYIEEYIYEE